MTLALDTTALLARYLSGAARTVVVKAMAADDDWCASALALTEALMVVDRVSDSPAEQAELRRALHDDWQRITVVPVDAACLDRAAELGREQPVGTSAALHLAAADRLPRPLAYATFDPNQIGVALSLGFTVVST